MRVILMIYLIITRSLGLCGIHCTDIFVIMPDIFNDDRQYNYISTRTNPNITYNNIVIERGYIGLRPIF